MRIKQLQMKNFKRFADLTIEQIPVSAKSVVIVGPNGSGKSCVFDAFEQIGGQRKDGLIREDDYLRKDPANPWHVII
jgi:chromosome segregation ATPase